MKKRMKQLFSVFLAALLIVLASSAYAVVNVQDDGSDMGVAVSLNFDGGITTSTDGSTVTVDPTTSTENYTFQTTVIASGHKEGVTTNVSTESNLTSAALSYGVIAVTFSKNKYVNIAAGVKGQMVTIYIVATTGRGPSDYFTITDDYVPASSSVAKTGWDDIRFDAAGDSVTLLWVDDTTGWVIISMNSVTVT